MIKIFPVPVKRETPPKRLEPPYDRWFQEQLAKHRALNARPAELNSFSRLLKVMYEKN
jgi:hypothetical protein